MGINTQTLVNLMSYPNEISEVEVEALVESIENYPYFQLGRSLLAKAMHDKQASNAYETLSIAAIYAPKRNLLRELFYEDLHIDRQVGYSSEEPSSLEEEVQSNYDPPVYTDTPIPTSETDEPTFDQDDSFTPQEEEEVQSDEVYNELEENLRKLRESKNKFSEEEEEEKKKITDESSSAFQNAEPDETNNNDTSASLILEEYTNLDSPLPQFGDNQQQQNELIDKFINSQDNVSLKIKPSAETDEQIEDLSSHSTEIGDNIISENLAKIYANQGKKDKAIEIYQKLIWKFPQKKAYFAEIIESLKTV